LGCDVKKIELEPHERFILAVVVVVLFLLFVTGCTYADRKSHPVSGTQSHICIIALCEWANTDVDRVGNPSAEGDVHEVVEERTESSQGEKGTLEVDPTAI